MPVRTANINDAPFLVALINSAYRGDASKKGWTTEADIIDGQYRILQPELEALIRRPGACFLIAENEHQEIEGTVFLEKREERLYLGMLSVNPELQAKGTGRALMLAAEEKARQMGCSAIFMRVINLRKELIGWYHRRGYYDTGKTESYTARDYEKINIPFHFNILEKKLEPST